jgi:hypothetical protein
LGYTGSSGLRGYNGSFDATVNFAFPGSATNLSSTFTNMAEPVTVATAAIAASLTMDIATSSILLYPAAYPATSNWTLNVRHSSTTPLGTSLGVGQAVTIQVLVAQGTTAFYCTQISIDQTVITPYWQGSAPTAGNASGIDSYAYSIIKTSATPTYAIFASLTQFKTG